MLPKEGPESPRLVAELENSPLNGCLGCPCSIAALELPLIRGPGSPRSATAAIEVPPIEEHGCTSYVATLELPPVEEPGGST
ncbi:hypothetical protein V6N13_114815 [Hibiscus sabdariffa]